MTFTETPLRGAFLIAPTPHVDERGFFARTWCAREAEALGLVSRFVQCSTSFNRRKGTLRGLHYQVSPAAEVKLVRCTRGAIYDVIVDLRPESPTFCGWYGVELNEENRLAVYIPEGFAHGFQTLADGTEVNYEISEFYSPAHARTVRWNDSAFGIRWPEAERVISDHDASTPDFRP